MGFICYSFHSKTQSQCRHPPAGTELSPLKMTLKIVLNYKDNTEIDINLAVINLCRASLTNKRKSSCVPCQWFGLEYGQVLMVQPNRLCNLLHLGTTLTCQPWNLLNCIHN